MVNSIRGYLDVRHSIVREYRVATVGVTSPAGEVATGNIHLQTAASRKRMMDIAQMHRYLVDLLRD